MPIENRDLAVGTRLVARYKGREYSAEVVETEEGIRYRLEDGREFKSPSSAGSTVMEGKACNGWRFWSLASDGEPEKKRPGRKPKAKANPAGFKRLEDGRAYCEACADAFEVGDDLDPAECPQGHKAAGEGI